MPYVEVLWFPGRDENQKKLLTEEITDSFVRVTGCKPDAVEIIFRIIGEIEMKLRFLASLLSLFILVNVNFASTTGKISGQIKDSRTGEVLIGVNVIVDGTTLGAATDIDGKYTILNVPPGTYTVVASMVGFDFFRGLGCFSCLGSGGLGLAMAGLSMMRWLSSSFPSTFGLLVSFSFCLSAACEFLLE